VKEAPSGERLGMLPYKGARRSSSGRRSEPGESWIMYLRIDVRVNLVSVQKAQPAARRRSDVKFFLQVCVGIPVLLCVFMAPVLFFMAGLDGTVRSPREALQDLVYVYLTGAGFGLLLVFMLKSSRSRTGRKIEAFGERFVGPILTFVVNGIVIWGLIILTRHC
jgi:hypothetical protein